MFLCEHVGVYMCVCVCMGGMCVSAVISNCEYMEVRTGCGVPQRWILDICHMSARSWTLVLMTGYSNCHLFSY